MAKMRYVSSRMVSVLVLTLILASVSASIMITANAASPIGINGPSLTAIGNLPILTPTLTATPQPLYMVSVDPSALADARNGTYIDSPLLYSVSNNSIYVIQVDENKVVDIINFDKNIQIFNAVVNPDYTKLYVLYYDSPKHFSTDLTNFNPDSGPYFYVATVDLKTDRIVDSTKNHGGLANGILGTPMKMLMSNDGKYVYIALYLSGVGGASTVYQFDTAAGTYSRYLVTNKLYVFPEQTSEVMDMALTPDGKYLYFTDPPHETMVRITVPDMGKYRNFNLDDDVYIDGPVLYGLAAGSDSQTVYVANYGYSNRSILVIQPDQLNWKNRLGFVQVDTTNKPKLIAVGPDGKKLHALEPDKDLVETQYYDINAIWTDATYATGNEPIDMALSPDGSRLYVLNSKDATVTALDINNKAAFAESPIKIGAEPRSLSMGPNAGSVWVNKTHNTASIGKLGLVTTFTRSPIALINNSSKTSGKGNGIFIAANGTFLPIVMINETTVPGPSAAASAVPTVTPGGSKANATASVTPLASTGANETASLSPSATTVPENTPRAVGTPGFEAMIAVAGLLAGCFMALRKKDN